MLTSSHQNTAAAKCAFAVYGEYQDTSILDLSGNVPYRVYLSIKQSASEATQDEESTATEGKAGRPLTILVTGSCLDLRHALHTGVVKLIDSTTSKTKKIVRVPKNEDQDVLERFPSPYGDDACEPWVLVQDSTPLSQPKGDSWRNLASISTSNETTFSASSLITVPALGTPDGVARVFTMIWDLTDTLRPWVLPGRTYRLLVPTNMTSMGVLWWGWGDREEILRAIEKSRKGSSGDPQPTFSLADLQSLSEPNPEMELTFRYVHRAAVRFRVVERVPVPPVLQVRLSLHPICESDPPDDTRKDSGVPWEKYPPDHDVRYNLRVTTTYPRTSPEGLTTAAPSTIPPTSSDSSDSPITVQLYGPQEHLFLRQPSRALLQPKYMSSDVSLPVFAKNPHLSNFRIVDTATGEDLVRQPRQTHPQVSHIKADETNFLTLHPGDSVTRDVELPYPTTRKRPQQGEPGYHLPRVREMEAGKEYRISLRGLRQASDPDEDGTGGSDDVATRGVGTVKEMGKGFWWREGTIAEVFAGIDSVPSDGKAGEADTQEGRGRQSALRKRVFGTRGLPLLMQSQDVVLVTCPSRSLSD